MILVVGVLWNLKFGSQKEKDFRFCGLRVRQSDDFTVRLDQEHMALEIEEIPCARGRADTDPATPSETMFGH